MANEEKILKPLLIGLCGFAGHGKSTAANMFKIFGFTEYALATPLKNACKELFGLTEEQVNGNKKLEVDPFWGVTPREILQKVGTELFREQLSTTMPNLKLGDFNILWIRRMEQFIEQERKKNPNAKIVISDVRNIDEAKAIKKLGGYIIRIENPRLDMKEEFRSHKSEQTITKIRFEGVAHNDGSLVDLFRNVDAFYNALMHGPKELILSYENYCDPNAKGIVINVAKDPLV